MCDDPSHREKPLKVAEAEVMGGLAVRILALCMMPAALGQVMGGYGSTLLTQFGDSDLINWLWGLAIFLSTTFSWGGWWIRTHRAAVQDEDLGHLMEACAAMLMTVAIAVLGCSLLEAGSPAGRLAWLGLCASSCLNLVGRCVFLVRRMRTVRRALA